MTLLIVIAAATTVGISKAVPGAICPGLMAAIPGILLWRSRRRRGPSGKVTRVVRSHASTGPGYHDVTITSGRKLPEICIRCGTPTRRCTPLRYDSHHTEANVYDWGRAGPFIAFAPIFSFLAAIISVAMIWIPIERRLKRWKESAGPVKFRIPHCARCGDVNPLVQRHFDFHGRIMVLEAHPAFQPGPGRG